MRLPPVRRAKRFVFVNIVALGSSRVKGGASHRANKKASRSARCGGSIPPLKGALGAVANALSAGHAFFLIHLGQRMDILLGNGLHGTHRHGRAFVVLGALLRIYGNHFDSFLSLLYATSFQKRPMRRQKNDSGSGRLGRSGGADVKADPEVQRASNFEPAKPILRI
jgi:hypothetical protein